MVIAKAAHDVRHDVGKREHDVSAIAHSLRLGNTLKYHLVDMAAFFLAEVLEGLYISVC